MPGLSGYDRWLTTDHLYEAQQAAADAMMDAWESFCEHRNGPPAPEVVDTILGPRPAPPRTEEVPFDCHEEEHPDHAIYEAWVVLENAIQDRWNRLEVEQEGRMYEQERQDLTDEHAKGTHDGYSVPHCPVCEAVEDEAECYTDEDMFRGDR